MTRRANRSAAAAALLPILMAGCSNNPENDPLMIAGTVIAYAILFGLFIYIIGKEIWGPGSN